MPVSHNGCTKLWDPGAFPCSRVAIYIFKLDRGCVLRLDFGVHHSYGTEVSFGWEGGITVAPQ